MRAIRGLAPFGLAACRAVTLSANEAAKVPSLRTNPTNSRSMSALRPDGKRPFIGLKPNSATSAVISPSDFGLHNALQTKGNRMVFLDFDYFGWDDPVKLASDFYWHPAMNLSEEHKSYWLKSMINLFKKKDILFEDRLKAALPLYAIRWVLIILNEFLSKDQKRTQHARSTEEYNWKEVKQFQLTKAFILCSSIREYIKNN